MLTLARVLLIGNLLNILLIIWRLLELGARFMVGPGPDRAPATPLMFLLHFTFLALCFSQRFFIRHYLEQRGSGEFGRPYDPGPGFEVLRPPAERNWFSFWLTAGNLLMAVPNVQSLIIAYYRPLMTMDILIGVHPLVYWHFAGCAFSLLLAALNFFFVVMVLRTRVMDRTMLSPGREKAFKFGILKLLHYTAACSLIWMAAVFGFLLIEAGYWLDSFIAWADWPKFETVTLADGPAARTALEATGPDGAGTPGSQEPPASGYEEITLDGPGGLVLRVTSPPGYIKIEVLDPDLMGMMTKNCDPIWRSGSTLSSPSFAPVAVYVRDQRSWARILENRKQPIPEFGSYDGLAWICPARTDKEYFLIADRLLADQLWPTKTAGHVPNYFASTPATVGQVGIRIFEDHKPTFGKPETIDADFNITGRVLMSGKVVRVMSRHRVKKSYQEKELEDHKRLNEAWYKALTEANPTREGEVDESAHKQQTS